MSLLIDLPRQFRDALQGPDLAVRNRSDDDGWTAIEYTGHAAEVLHSTRKRLVLVFEHHDRNVSPPHLEAVRASARTAETEVVLGSLDAACHDLARLVGAAPAEAWEHTARADGRSVTGREILTDALHEAHHHARDASRLTGTATSPGALIANPDL
jgi:hypothetical protein